MVGLQTFLHEHRGGIVLFLHYGKTDLWHIGFLSLRYSQKINLIYSNCVCPGLSLDVEVDGSGWILVRPCVDARDKDLALLLKSTWMNLGDVTACVCHQPVNHHSVHYTWKGGKRMRIAVITYQAFFVGTECRLVPILLAVEAEKSSFECVVGQ